MYEKYVTNRALTFIEAYPLSAKETLFTPIIYRMGLPMPKEVPYPTLNGIRDLAYFAGISDAALRTALSRAKAEGSILEIKDASGKIHYQVSPMTFEMGLDTIKRGTGQEGFTLAVFSFTTEEESARSSVREILKACGFQRLAQNTYINGRIDTVNLMKSMRKLGVEKNIYLFQCPVIDDPDLIQKILAVFDIENRAVFLNQFYDQMVSFLIEQDLSDEEVGRRLLYFGAIYWNICEVDEPPIPCIHLPPEYPMPKIKAFYHDFVERNQDKLVRYYLGVNL